MQINDNFMLILYHTLGIKSIYCSSGRNGVGLKKRKRLHGVMLEVQKTLYEWEMSDGFDWNLWKLTWSISFNC